MKKANLKSVILILLILLFLAFLVFAQPRQPTEAGGKSRKWAVIVGIDQYERGVTPLSCAVNDANLMAKVLEETAGFDRKHIYVLTSDAATKTHVPDRINIVKRIERIKKKVRPGDTFVFFFSGHGMSYKDEGYLLTIDSDPESRRTLEMSALKFSTLKEILRELTASRVILFIDACRNDPHKGKGMKDNLMSKSFSKNLRVVSGKDPSSRRKSFAAFYSCAPGQRSFEWQKKKQGFFTYYLARGIRGAARDKGGSVTLRSLEDYLARNVSTTVDREYMKDQEPWVDWQTSAGGGRWVFSRPRGGIAAKPTRRPETPSTPIARYTPSKPRDTETPMPEETPSAGDKEEAEKYFKSGNAYYNKGEYDRAIRDYNKAIELKPQHADAYNNRGEAYRNKGEYDRAIRDYNKAIEIKPRFAHPYNNRGVAYYIKGDYDQAIRDCNKAIEINPRFGNAYLIRGGVYFLKGKYDRTIRDYNKAIEINPRNDNAYLFRGFAYYNKGDYDQAIQDYNKVIELNPRFAKAYNNRGETYRKKGEYDRAIRDYNKAIELKSRYADAHNNRGEAYRNKGEYDQAIRDYNKAIEIKPRYAHPYNNRGWIYNEKGEYDRAIRDYNRAIEINPRYAYPYNNRGVTYYNKSDYNRAIKDYNKAIEINPQYALAYWNKAFACKKLKRYREAVKAYRNYIKYAPANDPDIQKAKKYIKELEGKY